MIVDAWIQHPTPQFLAHPMFESLRRWMGATEIPREIPLDFTVAALEAAGVQRALVCAWHGPQGPLSANDEVAAWVRARPGSADRRRLCGHLPADGRGARAAARGARAAPARAARPALAEGP